MEQQTSSLERTRVATKHCYTIHNTTGVVIGTVYALALFTVKRALSEMGAAYAYGPVAWTSNGKILTESRIYPWPGRK